MNDNTPSLEVFHCPTCGKPTTESLDACRHCHALLRGPNAGKPSGGIFADEGPGAKWGCIGSAALMIAIATGGVAFCNHEAAQRAKVEAQRQVDEEKQEEARYQERVKSGKVCVDGPDDLNISLEMHVKRSLKDPDSFQHIGSAITPADGPGYDAIMRYRARNSFGGFTTATATAKLYLAERNVCEVRSYRIIE